MEKMPLTNRQRAARSNPWARHLAAHRSMHPNDPAAMQNASRTYRPVRARTPKYRSNATGPAQQETSSPLLELGYKLVERLNDPRDDKVIEQGTLSLETTRRLPFSRHKLPLIFHAWIKHQDTDERIAYIDEGVITQHNFIYLGMVSADSYELMSQLIALLSDYNLVSVEKDEEKISWFTSMGFTPAYLKAKSKPMLDVTMQDFVVNNSIDLDNLPDEVVLIKTTDKKKANTTAPRKNNNNNTTAPRKNNNNSTTAP